MPVPSDPARLALDLAALGWHILPLSAASKRPLANCGECRQRRGTPAHPATGCPCLAAGRWCHGPRAATTDPATITAWWRREPRAIPGVAAGPSGLVLIDIDAHGGPLPPDLATGLLPGIDLAAEPIPRQAWDDPGRYRDGRDTLTLLAGLRGGLHPWPASPEHQPVTAATPSGGAHLWYLAPAQGLRQALADAHGRYGLAWQVDLKAGWSYGIAPGTATTTGAYEIGSGDPARPGRMPNWLAREVIRVTTTTPPRRSATAAPLSRPGGGPGPAAYLASVIARGAAQLAALTDGRKRALSALAYHAGGLLEWSGADRERVSAQLADAGTAAGLGPGISARIVHRAIANGIDRPVRPPGSQSSELRNCSKVVPPADGLSTSAGWQAPAEQGWVTR
jgi:Bifunctional DNA primase/polymerase, N-terminal